MLGLHGRPPKLEKRGLKSGTEDRFTPPLKVGQRFTYHGTPFEGMQYDETFKIIGIWADGRVRFVFDRESIQAMAHNQPPRSIVLSKEEWAELPKLYIGEGSEKKGLKKDVSSSPPHS